MKKVEKQPIFVVGSSRSGTTLLYAILLSSGEFAIYEAETRLIDSCASKYGDLRGEKHFRRFLQDWTLSKQFYRSGLSEQEFEQIAAKQRTSYFELLDGFMSAVAEKQGKRRWAEQTPGNIRHLKRLAQAFPNAGFIHIFRDGRDVAISKRKLGWTGTQSKDARKQLLHAALNWESSILAARAARPFLSNRYLEVRYEDLVSNPESVLETINRFAQLNLTLATIQDSSLGSLRKGNSAFDEEMHGVAQNTVGRWKQLRENEIAQLDATVGATLQKLGYDLNVNGHMPTSGLKRRYLLKHSIKQFLKCHTPLGRFASTELEIGLK